MKIARMLAAVAGGLVVGVAPLSAGSAAPATDRSEPLRPTVTQAKPVADVDALRQTCRSNHFGSYVCFESRGDHFYLKDTEKDGFSAAVVWETNYGRKDVCINEHGKGTWVDCNYNMREGRTVTFWAVNVDQETDFYNAWSDEQSAII